MDLRVQMERMSVRPVEMLILAVRVMMAVTDKTAAMVAMVDMQ